MRHAQDRPDPAQTHPIFCGSYDWHSSVHMHWSLLRLVRLAPSLPQRDAILLRFAAHFTAQAGAAELAYLQANAGFERPYGWAWLLALHVELLEFSESHAPAAQWAAALWPMVDLLVERTSTFLRLAHYPQRAGTHANSAFALVLFAHWAERCKHTGLALVIHESAMHWYGADHAYPSRYEPSGSDFLSAGLCEAMLMAHLLGPDFGAWWKGFAPLEPDLSAWLTPAIVSSRTDGQLVHLDGLNLSRAWCLRSLAKVLPVEHTQFDDAAQKHLDLTLPYVTGGDFVATHWLVSYALLALTRLHVSIAPGGTM